MATTNLVLDLTHFIALDIVTPSVVYTLLYQSVLQILGNVILLPYW